MKNDVYLGLGSNVGDKTKFLMDAVHLLGKKLNIVKTSRIYSSKPVGYTDQDIFLNMALYCRTDMEINSLLRFIKEVEKEVGRVERFRWGPREIDIDILFFNNEVYNSESLTVPHPRLHERDFVLVPLVDINPKLIHPVLNKTVEELLKEVKERSVL
ncbi:MAG: 2-amino-4-hydroxy-6-hydroxymethyldihydropteridine diphosphokinase [Hydrogenothermaceae bacterium]